MSLFEKGNSTRCDWCGFDLGSSENLDAHEGRHAGASPIILAVGFMPRKKHKPHAPVCTCSECERIREMIKEQKQAYWAKSGMAA